MSYKIVSDSSCNYLSTSDEHFATVPMHVMVGSHDWVDSAETDVDKLNEILFTTTEKTSSACPAPGEWLAAFKNAETIFCLTITHTLSGSYNSAMTAKDMYEEAHPDRHVYVIDSLATGPRMIFMIRRLEKLLSEGTDPDTVYHQVLEYRGYTDLIFSLESVKNFVGNGRMSGLLAKTIGILGMRFTGTASAEGKLQVLGKTRGPAKTLNFILKEMISRGYEGGPVIIAHVNNPDAAASLASLISGKFGNAELIETQKTTCLCSYYAEKGGLLIGYERVPDEETITFTEKFMEKVKSLKLKPSSLRK